MEYNPNETVLLIVDVQTTMMEDHPYQGEKLISGIQDLLTQSRKNHIEIIYVRHNGKDEFQPGTPGWQIYKEIQPAQDEKIFDKHFNSAFRQTSLKGYLEQKRIKLIILVGMQTEYCIDATCKVAFEYGFEVIIPEGVVTTYDNDTFLAEVINQYYSYGIWNNRYAKVKSLDEVKKLLQR